MLDALDAALFDFGQETGSALACLFFIFAGSMSISRCRGLLVENFFLACAQISVVEFVSLALVDAV